METIQRDRSSLIAIICCLVLIILGISIGGNLINFFDLPSILIVGGGTVFITAACFNFDEIFAASKLAKSEMSRKQSALGDISYYVIKVAELVHKKGILYVAGQKDIINAKSDFFAEGISLIADNVSYDYLENFVTQNTVFATERFKQSINIFRKAAEIAPAMGLVGTLIGLVQMLASLENISKIGPAMALALITTFYGSILSYVFFFPIAAKLERNANNELMIKKIYLEGLLSMNRQENPRILEMNLNNILPYDQQIHYFSSII